MNFSKCTPNGPSTLARASLVIIIITCSRGGLPKSGLSRRWGQLEMGFLDDHQTEPRKRNLPVILWAIDSKRKVFASQKPLFEGKKNEIEE